MKKLFFSFILFVPAVLFAQNQIAVNNINQVENDDQQIFASNNLQKASNKQINFQINQQVEVPQQQFALPKSSSVKSSGSFSSGNSSSGSSKTKAIRVSKKVSSKGFMKVFDKNIKQVHHYKKNHRIKKCPSF
jgi:hypothetical protein